MVTMTSDQQRVNPLGVAVGAALPASCVLTPGNRRHGSRARAPRKAKTAGRCPAAPALPPAGGKPPRSRGRKRWIVLAPPTPARSGYARATDGRTARPEPWGKANGKGLGAQRTRPSPRRTSKATAPVWLPAGGPAAGLTGLGATPALAATWPAIRTSSRESAVGDPLQHSHVPHSAALDDLRHLGLPLVGQGGDLPLVTPASLRTR